jgi:Ca2+-transporting ATPase
MIPTLRLLGLRRAIRFRRRKRRAARNSVRSGHAGDRQPLDHSERAQHLRSLPRHLQSSRSSASALTATDWPWTGSARSLQRRLEVDPTNRRSGLTQSEAERRLSDIGPNALPAAERPSLARRLLKQFGSALIYLLILALAFDLVAWVSEGARGVPVEALAIFAILLLNAGLGVLQEYRSERALDELEKLSAPRVWVFRGGSLEERNAAELVPGDLVRLEAGDRVPADGVAIDPESLGADESLLTGESLPVDKSHGDELFSGTLIVRGIGLFEVTRTGPRSAMGRLAGALSRIEPGRTLLERRIEELGRRVGIWVGVLSLLILAGGLAVEGFSHFSSVVMFAVAFGVAVVPEGMPAVMTLVLSFGVQRMARNNAVVRRLSAVEALGSVTVIASDKTGTLTSNKMVVDELEFAEGQEDQALLSLTLANDADHRSGAGDPLEQGLVEFARRRGADVEALRVAYPRVSTRPFDARWKYMRATVVTPGGSLQSYVKGAIEVVLEQSNLSPSARSEWLERADAAAAHGFKVLGLASGSGDVESGLTFLGFVTLWDAPRPEAARAVKAAKEAGIRVIMITGDHPTTARAIGERVGIDSPLALTGSELDQLSDEDFAKILDDVRIFSRMLPEHKVRIVDALSAKGEVVAMTGDGLNDAPALRRADVGVAMGKRGSDVAREVADVVLLDDHFATIVTAIEEGRVIYENIQNFIRFTFSSNVALMVLVLGGAVGSMLLGLRTPDGALLLPLSALQILWINFLGDGPPALAIAADRSPDVMRHPPRPPKSPLLDERSLRFIVLDGVFKGAVGLALLVALPELGVDLATTATVVFLYESVAKLISAYPARRIGSAPRMNPWLHVSVAAGLVLGLLCISIPALRSALALSPLGLEHVAIVGAAIMLTWFSGELVARALRSPTVQKLRARAA